MTLTTKKETMKTKNRPGELATIQHIGKVRDFLGEAISAIRQRGIDHDASKLESPEVEVFEEASARLRGLTYGSADYADCLADMKPALDHHYAHNRHHPEHFAGGVHGMTLIDLVEMLADWKAATLRHADGDLLRSIEINAKRFEICPEIVGILKRTAFEMGWL